MLPLRWKFFRIMCLLQVVFAGLNAGYSFFLFLNSMHLGFLVNAMAFTAIALFASMGFSLIHKNYPDEPPVGKQKKRFNILYIINFFLISFIGALIFRQSWIFSMWRLYYVELRILLWAIAPLAMYVLMFLLQIGILYGMFRLRRELYANYLKLVEGLTEK
jgi:hypothetical protein